MGFYWTKFVLHWQSQLYQSSSLHPSTSKQSASMLAHPGLLVTLLLRQVRLFYYSMTTPSHLFLGPPRVLLSLGFQLLWWSDGFSFAFSHNIAQPMYSLSFCVTISWLVLTPVFFEVPRWTFFSFKLFLCHELVRTSFWLN